MAGLVTIGEALVAMVSDDPGPLAEASGFRAHVVGAELNVAIGVARLGLPATFIGRVGADGFGTAIVRRLRAEAVDVQGVRIDAAAPTGILVRERRSIGPAELIYHRRGSAGSRLHVDDVETAASAIRSADWLHLTGITPALSASAAAAVSLAIEIARDVGHERPPIISLDINLRRKLWTVAQAAAAIRPLIARVDVVFSGLDEGGAIVGSAEVADRNAATAGDAAIDLGHALLALGVPLVVLKLGPDGAMAVRGGLPDVRRAGIKLDHMVDPVGAGDGFCAGFIAARLRDLDLETALTWGVGCGASVAATDGDVTGLPTPSELGALLDGATETRR